MPPDVVRAVIERLKADVTLDALVSGRVFGLQLPPAEAASMPRAAVVVVASGGAAQGETPLLQSRLDLRCYGATGYEAMSVWRAAYRALVPLRRQTAFTAAGVRVLDAALESGPIQAIEPEVDWPLVLGVFRLLVHEVTS